MRRFIAIFVLLQVVSGILAPIALASTAMTAACCRRNGKHHCMSGMSMVPGIFDDSRPAVRSSREACPHCAPLLSISSKAYMRQDLSLCPQVQ